MTEETINDEIDWKSIPKRQDSSEDFKTQFYSIMLFWIFRRRPTIRDFGRLYVTYVTEDKVFKEEPRVYLSGKNEAITKF